MHNDRDTLLEQQLDRIRMPEHERAQARIQLRKATVIVERFLGMVRTIRSAWYRVRVTLRRRPVRATVRA